MEMLEQEQFPEKTLFGGDQGFVGSPPCLAGLAHERDYVFVVSSISNPFDCRNDVRVLRPYSGGNEIIRAIPVCHCTDSFLESRSIIMPSEFRILEVRRGHVVAQPLDAVKQETLKFAGAAKYIENEIIVAQPLSVGPRTPCRWEVIASRVERRHLEAVDVYERVLALNPDDNQGIRYLLPSLYLKAQAPQKARAALERHGADGMNLYTRCLLEIQDGRRREAVRWLCRGLSYNLHLPEIVLAGKTEPRSDDAWGVVMGSRHEAAEYLEENRAWLRKKSRDFLRRLMSVKPFVRRLECATELRAALDQDSALTPGEVRSAKVAELFALFDEDHIPQILAECGDVL